MGSLKRKWLRHKPLRRENDLGTRARGLPEDLVYANFPEMPKMSDILSEFVKPYWNNCKSELEIERLLLLGQLAWNAALLSEGDRDDFVKKILEAARIEADPDVKAMIADLIGRKEEYFAHVDRMILSFELSTGPKGARLNVISTPERCP